MTRFRKIKEEELPMIMEWRMRPDITKYMYTDPQLTLEGQKRWYDSLQTAADRKAFMIEVDGVPSGILNITEIDFVNRRCSWGYYMAVQEKRSLPLALALEWNLYDYVFDVLQMNKLEGEIFSFNKAVLRMHQMCGSRIEGVRREHIWKNGVSYDVTVMGILRREWDALRGKHTYEKIPFEVGEG